MTAAAAVPTTAADGNVLAQLLQVDPSQRGPIAEVFSGGNLSGHAWFGWAGGVASLSGGFYDSGWRLRVLAGYGRYGYDMGGTANQASPMLLEVTPGYQFRSGALTTNLFAGLQAQQHRLDLPDPENRATQRGYGVKVASETWLDLPLDSALSLDLAYATRGDAVQARLRAGSSYVWPHIHTGGEVGMVGDTLAGRLRLGGFVRYGLGAAELEASGGFEHDFEDEGAFYLGASLLHRF